MSRFAALCCCLLPVLAAATPSAGAISGVRSVVGSGPGDQTDPHVSGSRVVYTHQYQGVSEIRYHDLVTGEDLSIPTGGAYDFLSDVSGETVVFTRITDSSTLYKLDLRQQGTPQELAPRTGASRRAAAIGGRQVVWQDFGYTTDLRTPEVVAYSLDTGMLTRLSEDKAADREPAISPDGRVVVWTKCEMDGSGCDLWQARVQPGGFLVRQLTLSQSEELQPDTSGELVVYVRQEPDAGPTERDLAWQPVGGGPEQRLLLPGAQSHPSVSGPLLAFEHRAPGALSSDIYVYDIRTRTLYPLTQTPENESLSDVSVSKDGQARVVWAALEGGDFNVYAYSFPLPQAGCQAPEDEEEMDPEQVCLNPGTRPLLGTLQLVRSTGKPDTASVSFQATQDAEGVVCVDNGLGGARASAGWVWLNGDNVIPPDCFRHELPVLAERVSFEHSNTLSARIAGRTGTAFRVRVYGTAPTCARTPGGTLLLGEPLDPVAFEPADPLELAATERFIREGDEGTPLPVATPPGDGSGEGGSPAPGGSAKAPGELAAISEESTTRELQGGCSTGGGGLSGLGLLLLASRLAPRRVRRRATSGVGSRADGG